MGYETYSDSEILRRYSEEPEEGFRLLVIEYREKLYYHIRRLLIVHEDADDALQNTFIKVWQSLPGFKSKSSLYTWLYRISTNEALQLLKKRKDSIQGRYEDLEYLFSTSIESDTYFNGDEAYRKLLNAILKLPEQQQLVFNMKYFEEMKYQEIAEILSVSVGSLKASYHHARKKIEKYLSDD